jgi:hypothetical protein
MEMQTGLETTGYSSLPRTTKKDKSKKKKYFSVVIGASDMDDVNQQHQGQGTADAAMGRGGLPYAPSYSKVKVDSS